MTPRHNPPVYEAGERESILLARVCRLNRALRYGRITGGTFDSILSRIRAGLEKSKAADHAAWESQCAARAEARKQRESNNGE